MARSFRSPRLTFLILLFSSILRAEGIPASPVGDASSMVPASPGPKLSLQATCVSNGGTLLPTGGCLFQSDPKAFQAQLKRQGVPVFYSPNSPSAFSISLHGRFCGPINSGEADPIDCADAACKEHDECLPSLGPWLDTATKAKCEREFCQALTACKDAGNEFPKEILDYACLMASNPVVFTHLVICTSIKAKHGALITVCELAGF